MSAPSAQNPSPQWTKHSSPVGTRSALAVWKIVIRHRIPTPPLSVAQPAGPQPTKSSTLARGITPSIRSEAMARNAGLLAVVSALERSSHLLPTRCHRQDFESKFYSSFTYGHFMKFSFTLFYVYGISFHSWLFRKLCLRVMFINFKFIKFLFYNRGSITLLHIWKTKYEVVPFTLFKYKQKDFENVFPTIENLHVMVFLSKYSMGLSISYNIFCKCM